MSPLFYYLVAEIIFALALAIAATGPLRLVRHAWRRIPGASGPRRLHPAAASERGQGLVELSLLLPLFLVIAIGVIEVGNGINSYMTVVNSARDGARLGSKGAASDSDIKNLIVTETDRLRDDVDPNSDITVQHLQVDGVDAVKVTVCNDHTLLLDVPLLMPDNFRMCSTTVMRELPS
jgi:hypothetical protein